MGISVLMSVYGKEKPGYLRAALESLLAQTRLPEEIVLIEDGPLPEDLERVIQDYRHREIPVVTYRFEHNVKLGRALEKGLTLCSNELVARMDTDDIALPDRFLIQYSYMMEHTDIAACGGWMEEFNDAGTYSRIKKMPENPDEIAMYTKYRNPLNHMTVMFRKAEVLKAGNYRHFPYLEDYDLWIRMLAGGCRFYNIPKVLVRMRNNEAVYARRGGMAYFRIYKNLRKEQRSLKMLSAPQYLKAMILTAGITLQPSAFRKVLYQKILRR